MSAAAGLRRRIARSFSDERGSIAALTAIVGVCLVASLAIGIDAASVSLQRRRDQGALDLAAIAAARDLGMAEARARDTLANNGIASPKAFTLTVGNYSADPKLPSAQRFRPNTAPVNAARLTMTTEAKLYFGGQLTPDRKIAVQTAALSVNTRVVSFSIGSRLASLDQGVANAVLSALLGSTISLNVMDYNALATADVDMPDMLNALAPRLGVSAGTYDDVLALKPTLGQVALALSDASNANALTRGALNVIAAAGNTRRVNLRALLSFGPFANLKLGTRPGLTAAASALDILSAAAAVANGSRQLDLSLGAKVPGVLETTASVTIGERPQSSPWLALGAEGATVRTAQTRVRLSARVAGLNGLPELRLPIALDIASGVGTIDSAVCGRNPRSDASVSVMATPSIAELWVGEPTSLTAWNSMAMAPQVGPATVLDAALLLVTASSHVAATNMQPKKLVFDAVDIAKRKAKYVQTTNIAQSTLTSLTNNLAITAQVRPLVSIGAPAGTVSLLGQILQPIGAKLDPLLNDILNLVGVSVGEADVTVRGLRCDGSALVG